MVAEEKRVLTLTRALRTEKVIKDQRHERGHSVERGQDKRPQTCL